MWVLSKIDAVGATPVPTFWLCAGRTYKVGRKDCDIHLDDKSVSREHATIIVDPVSKQQIYDLNSKPAIKVLDNAKFGTFINNTKCAKNTDNFMRDGDVLRFGTGSCMFAVQYHPLVFCPSNLTSKLKTNLQELVITLGGHCDEKQFTHLVMTELKLTSKVVTALARGKPVVTMQWIEAIINRALPSEVLPNTEQFQPPLSVGDELNDPKIFYPNPTRKTLLKGRVFIFLSKEQLGKASEIVASASGEVVSLVDQDELPNSLLQTIADQRKPRPTSQKKQFFVVFNPPNELGDQLISAGCKATTEEEIGLCIILHDNINYCNTEEPNDNNSQMSVNVSQVDTPKSVKQQTQDTIKPASLNVSKSPLSSQNSPVVSPVSNPEPPMKKVSPKTKSPTAKDVMEIDDDVPPMKVAVPSKEPNKLSLKPPSVPTNDNAGTPLQSIVPPKPPSKPTQSKLMALVDNINSTTNKKLTTTTLKKGPASKNAAQDEFDKKDEEEPPIEEQLKDATMLTENQSLLVKRKADSISHTDTPPMRDTTNGPNFKRFKKVWPTYMNHSEQPQPAQPSEHAQRPKITLQAVPVVSKELNELFEKVKHESEVVTEAEEKKAEDLFNAKVAAKPRSKKKT